MDKINVIDIIDHQNKYSIQRFMVLDREPIYLYECKGDWLIAEDSGFFNFFNHDSPSGRFYAFAGRKFDINMKDGTIIKAYGQWWAGVPLDYQELVIHAAYGTTNGLSRCNVFCSCSVDPDIIDVWLSKNEPSNNYSKYDKRHSDYGKHKIKSKFKINP